MTPLITLALISSPLTFAGVFADKTMRAPLSSREIERGLVLGKGWLELGLGADMKRAEGYWGPDGEALDFDAASFLYTRERAQLRYGITARSDLVLMVPFHYIQLTNDVLGTDTSGLYLGDPRMAWRWQPWTTGTAGSVKALALVAEVKAPAGNEAPGSSIAGPSTFQEFVTTTGTYDARLGVETKAQRGNFAVGGQLGGVVSASNLAQFVVETDTNQFLGRIKPGSRVYAAVDLMAQLGPVALVVQPGVEAHGATRLGVSAAGLFPGKDLEPVEGSEGWSADLDANVIVNVSQGLDLTFGVNVPLRGEDLMFFPLEDIHPTRGLTSSATLELRY
ncbi:MAG: hypothetical protein RIT28_422 [Pseudomonadota bacterium]